MIKVSINQRKKREKNITIMKLSFFFMFLGVCSVSAIAEIPDEVTKNVDLTYVVDNEQALIAKKSDAVLLQSITITGTVTDAVGEPLPGASVVVKGTTQGTMTDANGAYSLPVSDGNAILVFSYIGYATREFPVGNQRVIHVTLLEDTRQIEEIVVVGYGIQRKSDVTGAITTINEDAIRNVLASTIDQKIIGQVAGVQIQQLTGAPGGGTSVKIRGNGSLGAGNEPLYVVDGMPYSSGKDQNTNPLILLNPNDIESVTILKDASSTAIYGSRGANGVIIITTKSGIKSKTQVNYSTNVGYQQVPEKGRPQMLNQREFAEMQRDRIDLAVRSRENREATLEDYPEEYRNLERLTGKGTDWYDLILRTAKVQEHNLNLTRGTENSRTFFSLGYSNQEGVLYNSGVERYNGKITIENKVGKFLINATFQPAYIDQKRVNTNDSRTDVIGISIWGNPVVSPYDESGNLKSYLQSPQNRYHTAWGFANPLFILQNSTRDYQAFQHIGSSFLCPPNSYVQ